MVPPATAIPNLDARFSCCLHQMFKSPVGDLTTASLLKVVKIGTAENLLRTARI